MTQDPFTYIIYTVLPLIFISLTLMDNRVNTLKSDRRRSLSTLITILVGFVFVFFVGLRYEVGRDYHGYSQWYKELVSTGKFPVDNDFGFIVLNQILKVLQAESFWLFVIIAFLQIYFLLKSTESIKRLRPLVFFFFFTLLLFFTSMNAMRQTLAFFIFVYAISVFNEKKYLKFSLLILLGFSFHKTILIPLLVLPFIHYKWYGARSIQFVLLVLSALILPSYFNALLELVSPLINLMGYSYYIENIDYMQEITDELKRGDGTSYILFFVIDAFIIGLSTKLSEVFPTKLFKQFYGYFFIGVILSRLFADNFILARIADYFIFFRVFILAFLAFYIFRFNKPTLKKIYAPALTLILIGLIAFYYKAIFNNAADVAPFKFIFS
jgi:hypothetical protein